jgi:hypothetical protein
MWTKHIRGLIIKKRLIIHKNKFLKNFLKICNTIIEVELKLFFLVSYILFKMILSISDITVLYGQQFIKLQLLK